MRVAKLTDPIVVRFELPWQAFALTGLGLIALLVVSWSKELSSRLQFSWARLRH